MAATPSPVLQTRGMFPPMSNAERQQRWRDKHRNRPPKMLFVPPSAAPPPMTLAAPAPRPASAVAGMPQPVVCCPHCARPIRVLAA